MSVGCSAHPHLANFAFYFILYTYYTYYTINFIFYTWLGWELYECRLVTPAWLHSLYTLYFILI